MHPQDMNRELLRQELKECTKKLRRANAMADTHLANALRHNAYAMKTAINMAIKSGSIPTVEQLREKLPVDERDIVELDVLKAAVSNVGVLSRAIGNVRPTLAMVFALPKGYPLFETEPAEKDWEMDPDMTPPNEDEAA